MEIVARFNEKAPTRSYMLRNRQFLNRPGAQFRVTEEERNFMKAEITHDRRRNPIPMFEFEEVAASAAAASKVASSPAGGVKKPSGRKSGGRRGKGKSSKRLSVGGPREVGVPSRGGTLEDA